MYRGKNIVCNKIDITDQECGEHRKHQCYRLSIVGKILAGRIQQGKYKKQFTVAAGPGVGEE